jgi:cytochrome c-type biogenesis protein CcmH
VKLNRILILFVFLAFGNTLVAEILVYPFADPVKEERFNILIKELRCPKCQNNNLADSNAPLAVDLIDIIYEKIILDETDEQIVFFLKQRYGDFISYRPPVKPSTWLIWFGPFVFLFMGGFFIYKFVSAGQIVKPRAKETERSAASKALIQQWHEEISDENTEQKHKAQESQQ